MSLRRPLFPLRIPPAGEDPDVRLGLQGVLARIYEAGRDRRRLRYDAPCVPPLNPEDGARAAALIREAPAET